MPDPTSIAGEVNASRPDSQTVASDAPIETALQRVPRTCMAEHGERPFPIHFSTCSCSELARTTAPVVRAEFVAAPRRQITRTTAALGIIEPSKAKRFGFVTLDGISYTLAAGGRPVSMTVTVCARERKNSVALGRAIDHYEAAA